MGWFKTKPQEVVHRTVVEISEESRQALAGVSGDLVAFVEVAQEIGAQLAAILKTVNGAMEDGASIATVGVRAFADEKPEEPPLRQLTPTVPEGDRIRDTPFTRRPRTEQVAWLLQIVGDGQWHSPHSIAKEYANDTGHFRYLKHSVGARLREMHEDGLVERRKLDSPKTVGAMFEYRKR